MSRLTKYQFLVLATLLDRPMHPYAVRQGVIALTGHEVWPSKTSLRKTMNSLLGSGYIEECRSDPHYWLKARRGAPYEITEVGYSTVRRELSMYFEVVVKSRNWLGKFDVEAANGVH